MSGDSSGSTEGRSGWGEVKSEFSREKRGIAGFALESDLVSSRTLRNSASHISRLNAGTRCGSISPAFTAPRTPSRERIQFDAPRAMRWKHTGNMRVGLEALSTHLRPGRTGPASSGRQPGQPDRAWLRAGSSRTRQQGAAMERPCFRRRHVHDTPPRRATRPKRDAARRRSATIPSVHKTITIPPPAEKVLPQRGRWDARRDATSVRTESFYDSPVHS